MVDKKLFIHLLVPVILLITSLIWSYYSWYQEVEGLKDSGWFARSGAILVIFSIWSSLITRPFVYDHTFPNLVAIFDGEDVKDHWIKEFKILGILQLVEIGLAIIGTVIWAYGDLWIC